MRNFFRILLLALVLMTVALISALTAMQLAIHGREVAIPKLVGMSPSEAERMGAASGLQVVVERQFYSPDIPEGKIMTQVPPPGTKVRRGWSVRVAQSLGPLRVAIPDVTGGSERVAELNIRRRGLSSRFGGARQFAGRSAGPGDIAKPAGECQRSVGAKDQSAGQRRPRAVDLCDAEPRWTAAGQRDSGIAGRRDQGRQSQRASSAAPTGRAASGAGCAICCFRGQRGEHDCEPDSGAGTENCGGQRGEFRSSIGRLAAIYLRFDHCRSIIAAKNPSHGCTPGIVLR